MDLTGNIQDAGTSLTDLLDEMLEGKLEGGSDDRGDLEEDLNNACLDVVRAVNLLRIDANDSDEKDYKQYVDEHRLSRSQLGV